jgi:hypothetical protein
MLAWFNDSTPALWLPERAFDHVDHLSKRLLMATPLIFIGLKILDEHLSGPNASRGWYCIIAGFFAKIDNISFWVVIGGLLSARNAIKAWAQLPPLGKNDSVPVTSGDLRRTVVLALIIVSIYVAVMYPSNGTFFKPVPKQERPAQVLEGLTNCVLAGLFYFFLLAGQVVARRALYLVSVNDPAFTADNRKRCASLLANAPFCVFTAAIGGITFWPLVKYFGSLGYTHLGYAWLDWTAFKPNPWSEVVGGALGGIGLNVAYFLPWLTLFWDSKRILPPGCRLRINKFWITLIIALQGGILSLISSAIKDLTGKVAAFEFFFRVEC